MTTFNGFPEAQTNYTKVPNALLEAMDLLTGNELKVVLYVVRHTWGYQDSEPRKLTNDEFENGRKRRDGTRMDGGVGLSKPTIISSIKGATKKGFLVVETDASDSARVKKYYGLNMAENRGKESLPHTENQGSKTFTPGVKKFDPRGKESLPRTEKETLERNLRKKVEEDQGDLCSKKLSKPAPSTPQESLISFDEIPVIKEPQSIPFNPPLEPGSVRKPAKVNGGSSSRKATSQRGQVTNPNFDARKLDEYKLIPEGIGTTPLEVWREYYDFHPTAHQMRTIKDFDLGKWRSVVKECSERSFKNCGPVIDVYQNGFKNGGTHATSKQQRQSATPQIGAPRPDGYQPRVWTVEPSQADATSGMPELSIRHSAER